MKKVAGLTPGVFFGRTLRTEPRQVKRYYRTVRSSAVSPTHVSVIRVSEHRPAPEETWWSRMDISLRFFYLGNRSRRAVLVRLPS